MKKKEMILFPFLFIYCLIQTGFNYTSTYNNSPLPPKDIDAYYMAAKAIYEGQNPYARSKMREMAEKFIRDGSLDEKGSWFYFPHSSYIYFPTLAVLMIPIQKYFDIRDARFIWLTFLIWILFFFFYFILHFVPENILSQTGQQLLVIVLFLGLYNSIGNGIYYGNVNLLMAALLVAFIYCLKKGKAFLAGSILAWGILIKLTPLIFIPWLFLRGKRKIICVTILAGILWIVVEWVFFKTFGYWTEYIFEVLPEISNAAGSSLSIKGLLMRLLTENPMWSPPHRELGLIPLINRPDVENWLFLSVSLILIITTGLIFLKTHKIPSCLELEFAALLILINIITPIVWPHNLLFLILPILILFREWRKGENRIYDLMLSMSLFLIFIDTLYDLEMHFSNPILAILVGKPALILYGMIILWLLSLLILYRNSGRRNMSSPIFV